MLYITFQERENKEKQSNNHRLQFGYHKLSRIILHGREEGDASRETIEGQF